MITQDAFDMAPCLRDGPYAESGRLLIASTERLGNGRWASVVRAWAVAHLFHEQERIFASGNDPVPAFCEALERLAGLVGSVRESGVPDLTGFAASYVEQDNSDDLLQATGKYYGNLFKDFSKESYLEATELLRLRLERNGITAATLANKRALDAGCGGGRYTAALRNLGARPVVGVDISSVGIANARQQAEAMGLSDVTFKEGNVLDLPFPDNEFDFVLSNGVLLVTTDWEKGVAEVLRVMKPGGFGFLYLIENPGGIFWDMVEILRVVMKGENKPAAQAALRALGVPANRTFYMLDHVMVAINIRLAPEEVEECLRLNGAQDIRRLSRGTDFDRVEALHRNDPFAAEKFGVGENRYVFSK
jgi:ubiquinone/menaquinone biosynthesis C-methylase UbiE